MRRRNGQTAAVLGIVGATVLLLSACGGPTRSVAAYCSYFYGEGEQLQQRWLHADQADSQDPFVELGSVFADLPEAASFLHQLSLRAPENIAPDVQSLSEAIGSVSGQAGAAATDPLGALASGLVEGFTTSGAEQRVNEYTEHNCGAPPGSGGNSP